MSEVSLSLFLKTSYLSHSFLPKKGSVCQIPPPPRLCHVQPRSLPLWFRATPNRDVSTDSLARPFTRSLAPLTHSLGRHCLLGSLCSYAPLRSFIHFLTRSKTPELVIHVLKSGCYDPKCPPPKTVSVRRDSPYLVLETPYLLYSTRLVSP